MKHHILSILLVFIFSGCIMEDNGDLCPESEEGGPGYITISFNLAASNSRNTRANDEGKWDEFEDYIDTDDCAFFIYAIISETVQPLIKVVDINTPMEDPHTHISGGPLVYNVKVSIPKSAIDNTIPEESDELKFRIVAFVNTSHKYKSLITSVASQSFSTLMEEATRWDYNLLETIYTGSDGSGSKLNTDAKIPMYGTKTFTTTRLEIQDSRPDSSVFGGNLSLLRSLAKIQVIDAISYRDANTGLPRIESVLFDSSTDNAYMLPVSASSYENGSQVTQMNMCAGDPMKLSLYSKDVTNWTTYVPEQMVKSEEEFVPTFTITVTYDVDANGTPTTQKSFIVPMTGYKTQSFDYGANILRNHIYTLSINVVVDADGEIVLTPYLGVTLQPSFGFD